MLKRRSVLPTADEGGEKKVDATSLDRKEKKKTGEGKERYSRVHAASGREEERRKSSARVRQKKERRHRPAAGEGKSRKKGRVFLSRSNAGKKRASESPRSVRKIYHPFRRAEKTAGKKKERGVLAKKGGRSSLSVTGKGSFQQGQEGEGRKVLSEVEGEGKGRGSDTRHENKGGRKKTSQPRSSRGRKTDFSAVLLRKERERGKKSLIKKNLDYRKKILVPHVSRSLEGI